MPNVFDAVLVAVVIAWGAVDHFVVWPRFGRAIAAGRAGARARIYGWIAIGEWGLTAAVILLWARSGRPFAALGLAMPTGVRLIVAAVIVALAAGLVLVQHRQVSALSPERLAKVAARHSGPIVMILPHTPGERNGFLLLAVTAGVCEELVARGYLLWFVAAWTGAWIALVVTSVLFGLGHAYQGRAGVVKTGVVGFVMGVIYLGTRSLVPGILVHALIDVGSGLVGYKLVAGGAAAEATAASPTPAH